ncbi:hypothetical protein BDY19DRAFT_110174 [Irpex rosettiformis]|uniref:Uncharacterized protein n=1 Tax=Irpex rosettiformis TaxID=378272 RepID=A0ACB8U5J7_9APHY|nr:hypothetical protein BDY19DRAFT_110174 [Irpex rosettiformis]
MFSSLPASPPHHPLDLPNRHDLDFSHNEFGEGDRSLIIPSLALPSALRPPTTHGHTLGRLRLLLLGGSNTESTAVTTEVVSLLTDENYPEVVHIGGWDDFTADGDEEVVAQAIRISTDWIEHREAHGEDRYEPCGNVELVKLGEYDSLDQPDATLNAALSIIQASFRAVSASEEPLAADSSASTLSSSTNPSSTLVTSLLHPPLSGGTALFTAAVIAPSTPPSPTDEHLITTLRTHLPVIVLSPSLHENTPNPDSNAPSSSSHGPSHLSATQTSISPSELRALLYHNHHAVNTLRREAAELFLRWEGYSPEIIAEALGLAKEATGDPSDPQQFGEFVPEAQEQTNTSGPAETREVALKTRTSSRKDGVKPRRDSTTSKGTLRGSQRAGTSTVRGRPRGYTMERRKTITAATHARPVVGPLARLDSLVSSQTTSQASSLSPPVQSRRRRYAVEHGLSAASGCAQGHDDSFVRNGSFSTFDPLHIPSLVRLALEGLLLGPLRLRLSRLFGRGSTPDDGFKLDGKEAGCSYYTGTADLDAKKRGASGGSFVPIALIAGAFCAGMGVGVILARSRM